MQPKQKLPDPLGMIARVRNKLNPACAVRKSPFCDYIISMRMQSVPYREIEAWLIEQGSEYRISSPTVFKNFKKVKLETRLTYAEEMLEKAGGFIKLDLVRELSQNIITQKARVDRLVRGEEKRREQQNYENYVDRRIRGEMELLNRMCRDLDDMLRKVPDEVARQNAEALKKMDDQGIPMSEDAQRVLADLILKGEIALSPSDLLTARPN